MIKKIISVLCALSVMVAGVTFTNAKDTKADDTVYSVPSINNFSEFNSLDKIATASVAASSKNYIKFTVTSDCTIKFACIFRDSATLKASVTSLNETETYAYDSKFCWGDENEIVSEYVKLKKGTYKLLLENRDNNTNISNIQIYLGAVYKSQLTTLTYVKEVSANSARIKINHIDKIDEVYVWMCNIVTETSIKSLGDSYYPDSNNEIVIPIDTKGSDDHINMYIKDVAGFENVVNYCIMTPSNTKVEGITNKVYTGSPLEQYNAKLSVGGDIPTYTTIYKNNTNVGTATVTFKGVGSWIGEVTKTFQILPSKANKDNKDTKKPTVKGVKNKKTYKKAVKIKFSDASGIKKATLNGKKIKSGKKVKKKGKYTLIIIDKAGNKIKIKFRIK